MKYTPISDFLNEKLSDKFSVEYEASGVELEEFYRD